MRAVPAPVEEVRVDRGRVVDGAAVVVEGAVDGETFFF